MSVLECITYFQYIESIFLIYNSVRALAKFTMLKYFQKSLRLFMLAKSQNKDLELKNFLQIVKIAIITKAKKNL